MLISLGMSRTLYSTCAIVNIMFYDAVLKMLPGHGQAQLIYINFIN